MRVRVRGTHHPIRHAGAVHLIYVGDDQVVHKIEQHDQKRYEDKAVPMAARVAGGGWRVEEEGRIIKLISN